MSQIKIEVMTDEQKSRFPEYIKRWTDIGLCTLPANRPMAEDAIRLMYSQSNLPVPKIVWCGSPLGNALVRAVLPSVGASVRDSVWASVWDSVGASVGASVGDSVGASVGASVRASVRDSVWDSVGASVRDSVRDSVGASVRDSVRDSVRASVRASVGDSVWDSVGASVGASVRDSVWDSVGASVGASVRDSVRASVRDSVWDSVGASVYGQHDAGWLSFYSIFNEVFGLKEETNKLQGLWKLAQSGGWALPHKEICWISERHNKVKRDDRGRLHCDGNSALSYPDGFSIYAWHGTRIPTKWGETHSNSWDAKWLLEEKNQELRRVLFQGLGYARVMASLGSKLLHTDKDMELHRIENVDLEPLLLLRVKCPSTNAFYALRVPPQMTRCEQARQWTFGDEPVELLYET
jgi:hypothetical protein